MKKQEFLDKLKASLWAMPEADTQRSLDYYSEMIDDRMEEGLTEEEAVAAIGDLDEIVGQILTETPRPPATVEKTPKRDHTKVWLIVLLVLGSPIWIPLVAAVLSVAISAYVTLWSVVLVLWCLTVAACVSPLACLISILFSFQESSVLVNLGAALLFAGLSILLFMVSMLATKGMLALTKLIWKFIKSIFTGKERRV